MKRTEGLLLRMGRGDHCRQVVRKEQAAAMVDGSPRLRLSVDRLGLEAWDPAAGSGAGAS